MQFTVTHVTCQQDSKEKRSKWTINDGAGGVFDGLVVAVGTCGQAQKINFAGRDSFQGKMIHSTQLDDVDWHGKRVVVIGGGPSAVEAVELAVHSGCATPAMMVTRTDKVLFLMACFSKHYLSTERAPLVPNSNS